MRMASPLGRRNEGSPLNGIAAIIEFPEPTMLALILLALAIVVLLAIVFGNEYLKLSTRTKNRERIQNQAIDEIFADKELSTEEIELMNDMLHRHAYENPLRAVTTREGFSECAGLEVERLIKEGAPGEFQKTGVKLRDIRVALGLDFVPVGKPITSTRELHVGQAITVEDSNDKANRKHRMVIKNIDEAFLYIDPEKRVAPSTFKDGSTISCDLWRDEDGRYTFDARIVYFGTEQGEWRIAHPSGRIERVQSREHFRMRFDQTVNVGFLNASIHDDDTFLRQRKAVTQVRAKITSLSAGGCAIVFQQAISKNIMLRIEIQIEDRPVILAEAKIIATSNITGGRTLARTRFVNIDDVSRDIISRHLLRKQQETISPTAT